jgi:peptidylprolyl isomerase
MKVPVAIGMLVVVVAAGYGLYLAGTHPVTSPSVSVTPEASVSPSASVAATINSSSLPTPMASTPAVSFSDVKPISTVVHVTLKTSKGDISLDLDGTKAPVAVGNFVYLANQHFYDEVTFHRVIPGFMIQSGDPLSKDPNKREQHGTGGPGYQFPNEDNDLHFVRGAIGMANSGRDTNGSQFFIMVADTPSLDGGYTNFGKVTAGMDVADAIAGVPRDSRDNPLDPVTINSITVQQ